MLKNYRITVNGTAYDVCVEELTSATSTPAASAPIAPAAPTPAAITNEAKPAKKESSVEGNAKVTAPMPGKIVGINVKPNDKVSKGDVVIVLEAMKMENEICASGDGVVVSVNVSIGDMVEAGDTLIALE